PIETIDPILDKIPEVFGVPMALHWYGTYTHNFNYGFPHYPPLEGVAERFRRANASGLVAMSYINGRLWDSCEKSFEQARPFACETLEGNIYRETYGKSSV